MSRNQEKIGYANHGYLKGKITVKAPEEKKELRVSETVHYCILREPNYHFSYISVHDICEEKVEVRVLEFIRDGYIAEYRGSFSDEVVDKREIYLDLNHSCVSIIGKPFNIYSFNGIFLSKIEQRKRRRQSV